ncbi:MAG TPA: CDP-diacylglycerol--glycerol-3-phosphate 3-phosphatidyltransferase [Pyrinomonadaceae bacterium]|nr:CDP-diacylglycerol--glycerol-3-phosphate 3-phosphatidyltransferase [Pyrinomonadaceae bacterium]
MNLPNSLTLLRIFIVPILVVVLLTPFSENWFGVPRHLLGVGLFLGAALTDFLDGHFARSRNQVTRLGQLLDPIADKLLISAALISLVENQLAPAWAVVIIIGREFAVTGLRSIAAADGVVISASKMGKFKMLVQVLTVALLIVSSVAGKPPVGNFGRPFPAIEFWSVPELRAAWLHLFGPESTTASDWQVLLYTAGRAMLWLVVISSCLSMYGYFKSFYRSILSSGRSERVALKSGEASIPVVRD